MAVSVSRARTVGACARDGVERVGDVHDPGGQRNVIAAQAERVAASVRSLVVQFDDRDVRGEKGHLSQDMRANRGVTLELLVLLGGQRRGFPKDRVADTDLADVVEKRAESEHFEVGLAEVQPPADEDRKSADPLGVTGGVRVPRVEHGRERSNRTEIGRLRLGLRRRQATDEIVERFGERIEFQADPGWMQRPAEVARRGHHPDLSSELVDGAGQRMRQPETAEPGEHERAERERAERPQCVAGGGAGRRVNRGKRVDTGRARRQERADGVLLAVQRKGPLRCGCALPRRLPRAAESC